MCTYMLMVVTRRRTHALGHALDLEGRELRGPLGTAENFMQTCICVCICVYMYTHT